MRLYILTSAICFLCLSASGQQLKFGKKTPEKIASSLWKDLNEKKPDRFIKQYCVNSKDYKVFMNFVKKSKRIPKDQKEAILTSNLKDVEYDLRNLNKKVFTQYWETYSSLPKNKLEIYRVDYEIRKNLKVILQEIDLKIILYDAIENNYYKLIVREGVFLKNRFMFSKISKIILCDEFGDEIIDNRKWNIEDDSIIEEAIPSFDEDFD
ncbi:MAG: hypothetical protein ACK4ND_08415 [Cytophagaceae bacterium]